MSRRGNMGAHTSSPRSWHRTSVSHGGDQSRWMPSVDAKPHDEGSAVTTNRDVLDAQREHWQATFQANPDMYGTNPSQPGAYAAELFTQHHLHEMLELGAGQGRDTLAFLRAGLRVTALDYAPDALASLRQAATAAGLADRLITLVHDVRQPIPLPDASVDAVYSHMLFNMALSTAQLLTLAAEVRRVLRPGGLHVYTVRHTGDAHYGIGTDHGDGMFENGGFIVHFFDRPLVDRLAFGYTMLDLTTFEEGDLPRRLWRITLRRNQPTSGHGIRAK
jgi:SAM-dependent methyltransferase